MLKTSAELTATAVKCHLLHHKKKWKKELSKEDPGYCLLTQKVNCAAYLQISAVANAHLTAESFLSGGAICKNVICSKKVDLTKSTKSRTNF